MQTSILECPNCRAALAPPGRFARSVVCAYCGVTVQIDRKAVSRATYRAALDAWNDPIAQGYPTFTTVAGAHYAPLRPLAEGDLAQVHLATRARFPTERVLLKVLRDPDQRPLLDHEVEVTRRLQASQAPGAADLSLRVPEPIASGVLHDLHEGGYGAVFRWAPVYEHTLEDVRSAYPGGVDPHVGLWLWRRILEILHFVHGSGLCHGAVLPQHVLVQEGDHGARLVGYGCADAPGHPLRHGTRRHADLYPDGDRVVSAATDLQMSARCVAFALGGEGISGEVPSSVPAPFADILREIAGGDLDGPRHRAAWALHEALAQVAEDAFGPPGFFPLTLPRTGLPHP